MLLGELLVIVEYCKFGNVHNYLFTNRHNYVNQIDSATGNIDYSYGSEDEEIIAEALNYDRYKDFLVSNKLCLIVRLNF